MNILELTPPPQGLRQEVSFSISATSYPASAIISAHFDPAGPAPETITSYIFLIILSSRKQYFYGSKITFKDSSFSHTTLNASPTFSRGNL